MTQTDSDLKVNRYNLKVDNFYQIICLSFSMKPSVKKEFAPLGEQFVSLTAAPVVEGPRRPLKQKENHRSWLPS